MSDKKWYRLTLNFADAGAMGVSVAPFLKGGIKKALKHAHKKMKRDGLIVTPLEELGYSFAFNVRQTDEEAAEFDKKTLKPLFLAQKKVGITYDFEVLKNE